MSTLRWLIRDTFRQSLAYGIFWILLAVSLITIVVCLTIRVEQAAPGSASSAVSRGTGTDLTTTGNEPGLHVVRGDLTMLFGAIRIPFGRDDRHTVHFLQLVLAGGVADTLGVLLALVWTAGFLPGFLDPRSISVLLAKPAARWLLLCGKYLGVLAFVLFHAVLFVGGTWLAIGLRTGIWDLAYLWAIPLLLLHFAVFFSVSLLLAVCTRSTVVCVFGSILFWLVAWGMNFGRHALVAGGMSMPSGRFSAPINGLVDLGYWVLPKPADFSMLLYDALGAKDYFGPAFDSNLLAGHSLSLWLSVVTSLGFTAYILFASARRFATTDY